MENNQPSNVKPIKKVTTNKAKADKATTEATQAAATAGAQAPVAAPKAPAPVAKVDLGEEIIKLKLLGQEQMKERAKAEQMVANLRGQIQEMICKESEIAAQVVLLESLQEGKIVTMASHLSLQPAQSAAPSNSDAQPKNSAEASKAATKTEPTKP